MFESVDSKDNHIFLSLSLDYFYKKLIFNINPIPTKTDRVFNQVITADTQITFNNLFKLLYFVFNIPSIACFSYFNCRDYL